ncbi:hypothetical protein N9181_01085, partial [bacterium]|nr:hypothetical protein [bacterium]
KVANQPPTKAPQKANNHRINRVIKVEAGNKPESKTQKTARVVLPAAEIIQPTVKTKTKTLVTRIPAQVAVEQVRTINPTTPKMRQVERSQMKKTKSRMVAVNPMTLPTNSQVASPHPTKTVVMDKKASRVLNMMVKRSNASVIT